MVAALTAAAMGLDSLADGWGAADDDDALAAAVVTAELHLCRWQTLQQRG